MGATRGSLDRSFTAKTTEMGRDSTGASIAETTMRLELSYLLKKGYIVEGAKVDSSISWNSGSSMRIETYYLENEIYILLGYRIGDKPPQRQRINLCRVSSNLGKGAVLYFLCPITYRRSRVLYMAYGSGAFYSREGYLKKWKLRIYYSSQTSSNLDRLNDKFWRYERKLEKDENELRRPGYYSGKPTRRLLKLQRWEDKRDRADILRFMPESLPKRLREWEI